MRWSQKLEVKDAWSKLAKDHGLQEDELDNATGGFLTFLLKRKHTTVGNMTKARKLGWTGYTDTWDAFCDRFDELEKEKILPPGKK